MNTVEAIKDRKQIEQMQKFLKERNERDYVMFSLGLNIALRISDLLSLRWKDVMDSKKEFKSIKIRERKTGKLREIELTDHSRKILIDYLNTLDQSDFDLNDHIFESREANDKPMTESKFLAKINGVTDSKTIGIGKVDAHVIKELKDNVKLNDIINKIREEDSIYYSIFMLLIYSDMKMTQILNLKAKDVEGLSEDLKHFIKEVVKDVPDNDYIFKEFKGRTKPVTRTMALKIFKDAAEFVGVKGDVGTHSLRKTWGWNLWQMGADPVLIMEALNHSSLQVTKRYLGITQGDINKLYNMVSF